jgi:hypothetical protein
VERDAARLLRDRLVAIALEWQAAFGVAPAITSVLSEFDASVLVGCPLGAYCEGSAARTAVSKGHDFVYNGVRYQVKANRPSGKPGSPVTLVAKASNYEWDRLIWILYDRDYRIVEAWEWTADEYRARFHEVNRVAPAHMRGGRRLTVPPA